MYETTAGELAEDCGYAFGESPTLRETGDGRVLDEDDVEVGITEDNSCWDSFAGELS